MYLNKSVNTPILEWVGPIDESKRRKHANIHVCRHVLDLVT